MSSTSLALGGAPKAKRSCPQYFGGVKCFNGANSLNNPTQFRRPPSALQHRQPLVIAEEPQNELPEEPQVNEPNNPKQRPKRTVTSTPTKNAVETVL